MISKISGQQVHLAPGGHGFAAIHPKYGTNNTTGTTFCAIEFRVLRFGLWVVFPPSPFHLTPYTLHLFSSRLPEQKRLDKGLQATIKHRIHISLFNIGPVILDHPVRLQYV